MRKFLALIMVVAMVATFASVVSAKDPVTVTYTFDGNDAGLTAHGDNITYNEDGTVTLGAESWFESDLDLANAESISITAKVVNTNAADAVWIFEVSSETAHNWPSEHYFAAFYDHNVETVTVQAFNDDDGSRTEQPQITVSSEELTEIRVDYSTNVLTTYLNGEKVADTTIADYCDIAHTITTGDRKAPVLQIGKANWGSGEYSNGLTIDELTITVTYGEGTTDAPATGDTEKAPSTGFATIALAIAAIGSGAYVVSKKQH